ncbi:hypothetical protein KDW_43470 [Dictyobacter vulcani]|uniref:Condensation domain-containing protein n=1 Tax=Dictyobacter vulcani TaxID=2607529 RepID=A0A5J4KQN3_9CHLR|nr:hypothetical protein KDW_43470 [Dictyobacter vulcani]
MRELSGFLHDQPSPLPELTFQYADYALWQREWLQGEELERQLSYWKQQLQGAPETVALFTDHPRTPVQTFNGAYQVRVLPAALCRQLKELTRQEDSTLFMTLLAAFKILIARYSGQDDIVLGTPIANRNRAEIEQIIGFFVNTLVLRTDLSGNPRSARSCSACVMFPWEPIHTRTCHLSRLWKRCK